MTSVQVCKGNLYRVYVEIQAKKFYYQFIVNPLLMKLLTVKQGNLLGL
jgi:hypothetical protein